MAKPSDHVRRLERGDDALRSREQLETIEGVDVRRAGVRRDPLVLQIGVLRTDARVVEPSRDRMGLHDLAIRVLQEVAEGTVQDAGLAEGERGAVPAELRTDPARLDTEQPHARRSDERGEDADRVRPAADARDHVLGVRADPFGVLGPRLVSDHPL
jgi:hypothetical protein